jgi:hypothetical protein
MSTEKKPVYLIQYVKQTSMLGEQVTISTNMPGESSEADIAKEIIKLGNVLDERMRALNAVVLKKTGKGLDEMGIDPGTVYISQEEEE